MGSLRTRRRVVCGFVVVSPGLIPGRGEAHASITSAPGRWEKNVSPPFFQPVKLAVLAPKPASCEHEAAPVLCELAPQASEEETNTLPKRRVLLVDDEVSVLLTMKAILEIAGFDVDTATSAREGRSRIKHHEYQMVITDMRMESDAAGREVIHAARTAPYHPAVALLTAHPLADDDWQDMGADKMLVKPMHVDALIQQLEKLLDNHAAKLSRISFAAAGEGAAKPAGTAARKRSSSPKKSPKTASGMEPERNGAAAV